MKKSIIILLIPAAFITIFIFLWETVILQTLLKIPDDFSYSADVISKDNFYDETKKEFPGEQVSVTKFSYEVKGVKDNNLIIKNIFDVRTPTGQKIFAVERLYGVDPLTGKHVNGVGDHDREGYLFAPRHLDKQPFTYWHINYDTPAQLVFSGEEDLFGLKVYRYQTDYHADQTENLGFLPGVGKSRGVNLDINLQVWIEPVSGWMVKYEDKTTAYYYDLATKERLHPWNQFTNTYTEDSVREQVRNATSAKNKLIVMEKDIPLVVGVLMLVLGLLWVIRKLRLAFTIPYRAVAVLVLIVGVLVMMGWLFDIEILKRIYPTFVGMNPVTAVSFILIAVAVFWRSRPSLRLLVVAISVMLCVIGSLRLASVYLGLPFQIDLLLFSDQVLTDSFKSSRMAPITAVNFLFIGLSLLAFYVPALRRKKVPQVLSSLVALSGAIGIITYVLGSFTPLTAPFLFSLALHTAILFFLIGIFLPVYQEVTSDQIPIDTLIRRILLLIAFIIPVTLTFSLANFTQQNINQQLQAKFDNETEAIEQQILSRVEIYKNALEGGKGLFAASDAVSRDEWKSYVESVGIIKNYPGIEAMSFAEYIDSEAKLTDHTKRVRAAGLGSYTVQPADTRTVYAPITFIEPQTKENIAALGFDLWSEVNRRTALEASRDSGLPAITGKIVLSQDIASGQDPVGFLMILPLYKNGEPTSTPQERRSAISGFVTAPFRVSDLIQGILSTTTTTTTTGFEIFDGSEVKADTRMYGNPMENPLFSKTRIIYPLGHPWTIRFATLTGFKLNSSEALIPTIITIGGLLFSTLLFAVFYVLVSSRARAITYANEATEGLVQEQSKLKTANEQIEERGRELTKKVLDLEDTKKATTNLLEDLNEEKNIMEKIKAKDEAILVSIGDGMIFIDQNGIVTNVNNQGASLLGYQVQEVIGHKYSDLWNIVDNKGTILSPEQRPIQMAMVGHPVKSNDYQYVRKDNIVFPVSLTVCPVGVDNKIIGVINIFRDITHEKDVDKMKTEFISLASHQLRTPLSAMKWFTEMLLNGDAGALNPEQKEYTQNVFDSNERMISLVNALLNISRIESGRLSVEPVPTDIKELVESVIIDIKQKADLKKQKLTVGINQNLPPVNLDPKLIREVYLNLLTNSIKYTPEGGEISVMVSANAGELISEIRDNGIGIPKEQQGKVFQKFFRADNAVKTEADGTGLGLYLIKSIVESSSGKIAFESTEGKGTTFWFSLPLAGVQAKKGEVSLNV